MKGLVVTLIFRQFTTVKIKHHLQPNSISIRNFKVSDDFKSKV